MSVGDIFILEFATTASGLAARANINGILYPVTQKDLTALVGTEVSDLIIPVYWDGTNFVDFLDLVKNLGRITTNESELLEQKTNINNLKSQTNQNSNEIARLHLINKLEIDANSLIEVDNPIDYQGYFYESKANGVGVNITEESFFELLQSDVIIGQTVFALVDTTGLIAGMKLSIADELNVEELTIISVDSGVQITTSATGNAYTVANGVGIGRTLKNVFNKEYQFNGTTSKAEVSGQTNVTVNTLYIDLDIKDIASLNPLFDFDSADAKQIRLIDDDINIIGTTTGNQVQYSNELAVGPSKLVMRWDGTEYDIILNGTVLTASSRFGSVPQFTIDELKMALKGTDFAELDIRIAILSSGSITEQQAQDITSGAVELDTVLTEANSEIYYDATQDPDANIISNLGTDAGYDLTGTDVVVADSEVIINYPVQVIREKISTNKYIDLLVLENVVKDIDANLVEVIKASISTNDTENPEAMTLDDNYDVGNEKVKSYSYLISISGNKIFITKEYTNLAASDSETQTVGSIVKV